MILGITAWVERRPATTSGVASYICLSAVPACRRRPGRRNTGLRTAPTTSRGWRNVRLWSSSPPVAEGWALRCAKPLCHLGPIGPIGLMWQMGSVGVRRDLGLVEEVGDVAVEVEHEGGASHVRLGEGNAETEHLGTHSGAD